MVADFAPPCGTISWFAIQEGPSRFAIFDTFDDDAGRNAHLKRFQNGGWPGANGRASKLNPDRHL
jgi:hypothetical protein